ncbi:hypothetical protein C0991_004853, partial [Blastosporella zonata]
VVVSKMIYYYLVTSFGAPENLGDATWYIPIDNLQTDTFTDEKSEFFREWSLYLGLS